MARPKTMHRAADDERAAIKRYVQRLRLRVETGSLARTYMDTIVDWIDKRVPRTRAKKGGL